MLAGQRLDVGIESLHRRGRHAHDPDRGLVAVHRHRHHGQQTRVLACLALAGTAELVVRAGRAGLGLLVGRVGAGHQQAGFDADGEAAGRLRVVAVERAVVEQVARHEVDDHHFEFFAFTAVGRDQAAVGVEADAIAGRGRDALADLGRLLRELLGVVDGEVGFCAGCHL